MGIEPQTLNVVQLGMGFFLIFFAFNSQAFIEQTIIDSKNSEGVVSEYAGYASAAIIYGVFTFANFIAAPIVGLLGARWAMVAGAITYGIFQAGFLFLNEPFLYISSALIGVGAAIIWTAQGKYIAMNSTDETASIHSGLFWGEYQVSLIGSGIFLYFAFRDLKDNDRIEDSKIRLVFGVFTAVTAAGVAILGLLRTPPKNESLIDPNIKSEPEMTPKELLYSTLNLLITKRMLFLSIASIYTGIELSFYSGIYPTAISFTDKLAKNTKTVIAFNAIAQGLGQGTVSFAFGIFGDITKKLGRIVIVFLGLIVHLLAFVAIYLNFPSDAPLDNTNDEGIIKPPSVTIAIICAYFLGFGDACWNTQIFSLLVANYNKKSAEAFAVLHLFQCLAASIAFLYASYFTMGIHTLILIITGILGFLGFFVAERLPTVTEEKNENSSNNVD
ncbi:hypothetical protein FO519_000855 [Halicephalobus sp. NKZ332]|nr:hypothetical protein FO519_000855 [Halicephalobus sp. NKZ332]